MKKYFYLIIFFFIIFSCKKNDNKEIIIKTNKNLKGAALDIKLTKGGNWAKKVQFGVANFTLTPQFVFWIEDNNGKYIDTLCISKKFGKQDWPLAKFDHNKTFRSSSLPYWMNKRLDLGLKSPTKNRPIADAVTLATPVNDFTVNTKIKEGLKEFVILAEFNRSYDVNEDFHAGEKAFTDSVINGQPSVIYAVKINLNDNIKNKIYRMSLIGHGGETGDDGKLYKDTDKLTTALDMVNIIEITIK